MTSTWTRWRPAVGNNYNILSQLQSHSSKINRWLCTSKYAHEISRWELPLTHERNGRTKFDAIGATTVSLTRSATTFKSFAKTINSLITRKPASSPRLWKFSRCLSKIIVRNISVVLVTDVAQTTLIIIVAFLSLKNCTLVVTVPITTKHSLIILCFSESCI